MEKLIFNFQKLFQMRLQQLIAAVLIFSSCTSNETAQSIINKSINYHDPESNWDDFDGTLTIELDMPDGSERKSLVAINNSSSDFKLTEYLKQDTIVRALVSDSCLLLFNGQTEFTEEVKTKHRLTCERANMYRDYYTYLYGLPMKLTDQGTNIDPTFERIEFKGKNYLRVRVTYDESVGKDIWYFYFDPTTYAMEVYQFFHDEAKNDGEYILLKDMVESKGLKIPKIREWYTNGEEKFLGADNLTSISN